MASTRLVIAACLAATPWLPAVGVPTGIGIADGETPAGEAGAESKSDSPVESAPARPRPASEYPLGATLLGERQTSRPSGDGSTIRIRIDARRASPGASDSPPLEETAATGSASTTVPSPEAREAGMIGPSTSEQLDAFGPPRATIGREVRAGVSWEPTAAYEAHPDGQAYPWQPASWGRQAIDPTWTPNHAWPRREEGAAYPWHPVRWNTVGNGSSWRPTDGWIRRRNGK